MGALLQQSILKYPAIVIVGALATYALTPLVRRLARGVGALDVPDGRHIHQYAVPRGGGVAVFLGFHCACAAIYLVPWVPFNGKLDAIWWWHLLILSSLTLFLGVLDDLCDLKAALKLAGQCAIAALAFAFDMRVGRVLGVHLPVGVDLVMTVLWFVGLMNAFNLIDGIDGLATGLAAIAAVGLAGSFLFRHTPGDALILFGLAGSCLAFLRYNFYPASVFLGDSGSLFLGLVLAAVAVSTDAKGTAVASIVVPLLAVGVPLFDTVLAVWRRTARRLLRIQDGVGEQGSGNIFAADTDHVHHRLLRAGLSHRAAATWLYGLSLALVSVGLLSLLYRSRALGIYILAFVVAVYVIVRHLAGLELWASGRAIVHGLKRPPRKALAMFLFPTLDLVALSAALWLSLALSTPGVPVTEFKRFWFDHLPLWVGVPFIGLFCARAYRRVWSRARVSEYALLVATLVGSILLAAGLAVVSGVAADPMSVVVLDVGAIEEPTVVLGRGMQHAFALQIMVYAGAALVLVAGVRALPRAIQDAMAWGQRSRSGDARKGHHVLLYGAGYRCTLFLFEQSLDSSHRREFLDVVGLLDDARSLRGRYVHGYEVFGGVDVARSVMQKHHIEQVIVTGDLRDGVLLELRAAARECGVRVSDWRPAVAELESAQDPGAPG